MDEHGSQAGELAAAREMLQRSADLLCDRVQFRALVGGQAGKPQAVTVVVEDITWLRRDDCCRELLDYLALYGPGENVILCIPGVTGH